MPKKKNQQWDFKTPIDARSAARVAKIGALKEGAWNVAEALARGSEEYWAYYQKERWFEAPLAVRAGAFKTEADYHAFIDGHRSKVLNEAVREMCSAAYAGNFRAFRALADCVKFIGQNGLAKQWADPLAKQIDDYVFQRWIASGGGSKPICEMHEYMRKVGRFNVDEFIRTTGSDNDRETIAKRVRALGYALNRGRPKGTQNAKR